MCDDEECPEAVNNPLIMTGFDFTSWLSGKGIDTVGIPPASPITRATLLFELVNTGKINVNELEDYLKEIGLMVPIVQN